MKSSKFFSTVSVVVLFFISIIESNSSGPPLPNGRDWVVVLSVDGGGIRGIVPAVLIENIERLIGKPITHTFDALAGTSAGSIITGMLNTPSSSNPHEAKFTAADCAKLFDSLGPILFKNHLRRLIRTTGGLSGSKYSAKPLEEFLQQKIGTTPMSSTVKFQVIVSYDFTNSNPFLFTTYNSNSKVPIWEAIRTSTAAPVLFKGHEMMVNGKRATIIDGGIAGGMSPDLYLVSEVRKLYPGKKIFLVSLATGQDKNPSKVRGKGKFSGSIPAVLKRTIISGLEAPIALGKMVINDDPNIEYHRIDVWLPKTCRMDVDNASIKNRRCLRELANNIVLSQKFRIMVDRLQKVSFGGIAPDANITKSISQQPQAESIAPAELKKKKPSIFSRLKRGTQKKSESY